MHKDGHPDQIRIVYCLNSKCCRLLLVVATVTAATVVVAAAVLSHGSSGSGSRGSS
jgi:hypothetical protein